jgi:hypothetical protein
VVGMTLSSAFGFADEMRVGLRGMVRRVWGKRGVKVRQRLQIAYAWRYLFLAVDSKGGQGEGRGSGVGADRGGSGPRA